MAINLLTNLEVRALEKTEKVTLGTYLGIFCYYFLPRVQLGTDSFVWNTFFKLRGLLVLAIALSLLVIAFQKDKSNKWKSFDLKNMIISAYLLYILTSIVYFILPELMG